MTALCSGVHSVTSYLPPRAHSKRSAKVLSEPGILLGLFSSMGIYTPYSRSAPVEARNHVEYCADSDPTRRYLSALDDGRIPVGHSREIADVCPSSFG